MVTWVTLHSAFGGGEIDVNLDRVQTIAHKNDETSTVVHFTDGDLYVLETLEDIRALRTQREN